MHNLNKYNIFVDIIAYLVYFSFLLSNPSLPMVRRGFVLAGLLTVVAAVNIQTGAIADLKGLLLPQTHAIAATRTFTNQGIDVINFVNTTVCGAGNPCILPDGAAVADDSTTTLHVCQMAGYNQVISVTTRGFASCGDNIITRWTGSAWSGINACTAGNHFIDTLVCGTPAVQNDAQCINSTVPTTVTAGQPFSGVITMKNTGVTNWTGNNYYLAIQNGNVWGLSNWGAVWSGWPSTTIAPNQTTAITVNGTAPTTPGVYPYVWRMTQNTVENFGENCNGNITVTAATTQCNDGIDNDGDGATDSADFSCTSTTDNDETFPKSACQDGIDNDVDGLIDYPNDPGCSGKQDNDEYNAPVGGASCQEGTQILNAIYSVINGSTDFSSLNQSRTSAYCNANDLLTAGAGVAPVCDNSSSPACGLQTHYEFNSFTMNGTQLGWTSNYSVAGDAAYDTVREEVRCVPGNATTTKYFTTYVRTSGPITDYYSLNQNKTTAFCDPGDTAIHGGGTNVFCDTAGNGGCGIQMLEFNGAVFNGTSEGWKTLYSMPGDSVYDTIQTTVVCLKKTALFDQALRVYHVVNEGTATDLYSLNQNHTDALCNPGDKVLGGAGNPAYCDNASNPACGRVQYLEYNNSVGVGNQQGWRASFDLGGDNIYDTQRVEATCLGLANSCGGGTTQCNDGIDNDGDGATDYAGGDYSCNSPSDNDETNPRSQCQDNTDNDGDGLIDYPNDPGCQNRQDNTESNGTGSSQCQDGIDNDGDGLIDMIDPGCSSPTDTNEADEICVAGNVLVYSLQPAGTSAAYESENSTLSQQLRGQGFTVTFRNRQSQPSITQSFLSQYNAVWFFNGCGGATGIPSSTELSAIRDYYLAGGNLILTVDDDSGDSAAVGSCQNRVNAIASNLGVQFSGHPYHGTTDLTAGICQAVSTSHPIFNNAAKVFRYSDALLSFTNSVTWGSTLPVSAGTLTVDGQNALALTPAASGHGRVIFDPAYGSFSNSCSTGPQLMRNAFGFLGLKATCSGGTQSQCNDGIDNDADGATDYPNDFSCSSATDTDETNPRSQCQDGLDNDGDGLVDLVDSGCSSKQDNDEGNGSGTTQCNDGIDNDGDGATDSADFSCTSTTDNDETNPKSACQDGYDNDADGLIDYPNDPGCSSRQDNDESTGTSSGQCQNGLDDDADGLVDSNDPGCHTDFNRYNSASYNPNGLEANNDRTKTCQDGYDNNANGLIDAQDAVCHTDNNVNNTSTYDPMRPETGSVSGSADLSVTLTGPSTITRGNTITYTAVVTNNGPSTATNITLIDPPAGFTFLSSQSTSGCYQNGTSVLCTLSSLNAGSSQTFTLAFSTQSATCNTSVIDIASVSASNADPNTSNNQSQSVSTYVSCSGTNSGNQCQNGTDDDGDGLTDYADPDCHTDGNAGNSTSYDGTRDESSGGDGCIDITVEDDHDPAFPGDDLEYEITVENTCSTDRTVTVRALLDNDMEFDDASNGGNDINDETVEWRNLTIRARDDKRLTLNVVLDDNLRDGDEVKLKVTAGGTSETEKTDIGYDNGGGGNVPPISSLAVTVQPDRTEARPGDTVTYTITARNNGNVVLDGATLESIYTSGQLSILDAAGGTVNGTAIRWQLGRLDPNTSRQLRYTTRMSTAMHNGDVVANNATLNAGGRTATASSIVRIINQIPQTGVGHSLMNASTSFLAPFRGNTSAQGTGGAVGIIAWLTTLTGGLGAGIVGARRFIA